MWRGCVCAAFLILAAQAAWLSKFGICHEAHFSAFQACSRPAPWVPVPDGNRWWPQYSSGATGARAQEAFGLRPELAGRMGSPPPTIRKRADFLAANRGSRVVTPAFILLVRRRDDGDSGLRAGFTVTKKIGGSVVRSRLKRRLREVVRLELADCGVAGADHVLIGRTAGLARDFDAMRADLVKACARIGQ